MKYVRITATKFRFEDSNGDPAVGYKVYTCTAGTTTLTSSWSNRGLSVLNTNPIVLDARGEAEVFTGGTTIALKLIVALPTSTGVADGVVQTEDYLGEQDAAVIDTVTLTSDGHNNYSGATTPVYATIPEGFTLTGFPSVNNLDTLASNNFTGSGINDITWGGPFTGTTDGSIFTLEITAAFVSPPGACTAAENVAAGAVTSGNHIIKITFVTAEGETLPGTASNTVAVGGVNNRKIDLTAIPCGAAGTVVTSRKIYMTEAGGSDYYLVDTLADNTTTTYTISISDADLAANAAAPVANTTGDGTDADVFKWKKDAGAYTTGVSFTTAVQNLTEGITIQSAEKAGHYVTDVFTLTVETPVRVNFCNLGNWPVYKSEGGVSKLLSGNDLIANMPAVLVASPSQTLWNLINPSLPILETLQPAFQYKEISSAYNITSADARKFLLVKNAATLTLDSLSSLVGVDWWIKSWDGSDITLNVAGGTDLIYGPFNASGVTSYVIPGEGYDNMRFASNGARCDVVSAIPRQHGTAVFTSTGTWTCPLGITTIYVTGCAQGGGGAGAAGGSGNDAGAGGVNGQFTIKQALTVVPGTTYTITINSAGGGGTGYANGAAGGDVSFGALLTLTGGAGGDKDGGAKHLLTADTLAFATDGKGGPFGGGGEGAKIGTATAAGTNKKDGVAATGYGAGGGGGAAIGGGQSANGAAGSAGILWLEY